MAAHTKPSSSPQPVEVIMAAASAKTHLLQLLDAVEQRGRAITITKRGRPVARLVPAPQVEGSAFDRVYGSMAGSAQATGDIVSPDWESWGPEWR